MKFINRLLNLYILKNRPLSLVHFVTNRCNARCGHCFIDFNNSDTFQDELSLEEIKNFTRKLGSFLFNINLTGGEPFLRRDFFEIAEAYFKNAGVQSVFISTNGMFTNRIKEFIDRFVASKIKGKIIFSISIDNFEELHDKNRKILGLFKNAIQTFKLIRNYNYPNIIANIAITVAEHNYGNVVNLYHQLKKMDVKNITATIWREEGIIKKIDFEVKTNILKAYFELTNLIHSDLLKKDTQRFKMHFYDTIFNSKNIILDQIIRETYLKPKYICHCSGASLFAVIHANGDIFPCEILTRPLGNLRDYDMDFMELYNANEANACRKFIREMNCSCVYGCAWTVNIISNPRFLPRLIYNFMKQI